MCPLRISITNNEFHKTWIKVCITLMVITSSRRTAYGLMTQMGHPGDWSSNCHSKARSEAEKRYLSNGHGLSLCPRMQPKISGYMKLKLMSSLRMSDWSTHVKLGHPKMPGSLFSNRSSLSRIIRGCSLSSIGLRRDA